MTHIISILIIGITLWRNTKARCPQGYPSFERTARIALPTATSTFTDLAMVVENSNASRLYPCPFLCNITENCAGFYVDDIHRTCRLVTTLPVLSVTSEEDEGSFFRKVCHSVVPCSRQWAFDHVPGMKLFGLSKLLVNATTRDACMDACLAEKEFVCRSAEFDDAKRTCHLSRANRRTDIKAFRPTNRSIHYMENQCIKEPRKCSFTIVKRSTILSTSLVMVGSDISPSTCQTACLTEEHFVCRSFVWDRELHRCYLSSDDSKSAVVAIANSHDLYLKGECLEVSMKCDATTMTAILTVTPPFTGRLYAIKEPSNCYTVGHEGEASIALTMNLHGTQCGTKNLGNGTYMNTVIVQHHPTILRSSDKRIDVACDYQEHHMRLRSGKQIEVDQDISNMTTVITGAAPPPQVKLRIANITGDDVKNVELGAQMFLRVDLVDEKVYGIFGSALKATSGDGSEVITLLDDKGCPVESSVFPGLELIPGSKSLQAPFNAFRFTSDSTVRFQMTVSFCLDLCPPVKCGMEDNSNILSYGRRRRRSPTYNLTSGDIVSDVTMERSFKVITNLVSKDDISEKGIQPNAKGISTSEVSRDICMTTTVFTIVCSVLAIVQCLMLSTCIFFACNRCSRKSTRKTTDLM